MTGYYRFPTASAEHLAFVWEDALWVQDRGGGPARRLTAGSEQIHEPCISPDGQSIRLRSRAKQSFVA